jgi:zinc transporter, ZIP family
MLLIVAVMSLHSVAEGVGIGVGFGSHHDTFGRAIAISLAIHNAPEGLATALVLLPRGVSLLEAAVWCVVTSLPQPAMAPLAFAAVTWFQPLLPFGLGFAAGAMVWLAAMELWPEACEAIGKPAAATVAASAAGLFFAINALVGG